MTPPAGRYARASHQRLAASDLAADAQRAGRTLSGVVVQFA